MFTRVHGNSCWSHGANIRDFRVYSEDTDLAPESDDPRRHYY